MSDIDRVVSFSLKPDNKDGRKQVKALKDYCEAHNMVFSALMVQAIKDLNEKLGIHVSPQR